MALRREVISASFLLTLLTSPVSFGQGIYNDDGFSTAFKDACVSEALKKDRDTPLWYATYFCDCARREIKQGASEAQTLKFCSDQVRNVVRGLTQDCIRRIGRDERNLPQIRVCVDIGPAR